MSLISATHFLKTFQIPLRNNKCCSQLINLNSSRVSTSCFYPIFLHQKRTILTRKMMRRQLKEGNVQSKYEKSKTQVEDVASKAAELNSSNIHGSRLSEQTNNGADQDDVQPEKKRFMKLGVYPDPYMLSKRIKYLLSLKEARLDEAFVLFKKHQNISLNSIVASSFMKRLFDMKEFQHVFRVYKIVHAMKLELNPTMITILLKSFQGLAKSQDKLQSPVERQEIFEKAVHFWHLLPEDSVSTIHMNAFLQLCFTCAAEGGWEKAMDIYFALIGEKQLEVKLPKPDSITFTALFSICAENRSQDGFEAMKHIWLSIQSLIEKNKLDTDAIDEQMLCPILLNCIRVKSIKDAEFGMEIVNEWFKLPISISEKDNTVNTLTTGQYDSFHFSSKSLDVLMRYANRVKRHELSWYWYQMALKKPDFIVDDILKKTIVNTSILLKNDPNSADSLMTSFTDASSSAMDRNTKNMDARSQRIQENHASSEQSSSSNSPPILSQLEKETLSSPTKSNLSLLTKLYFNQVTESGDNKEELSKLKVKLKTLLKEMTRIKICKTVSGQTLYQLVFMLKELEDHAQFLDFLSSPPWRAQLTETCRSVFERGILSFPYFMLYDFQSSENSELAQMRTKDRDSFELRVPGPLKYRRSYSFLSQQHSLFQEDYHQDQEVEYRKSCIDVCLEYIDKHQILMKDSSFWREIVLTNSTNQLEKNEEHEAKDFLENEDNLKFILKQKTRIQMIQLNLNQVLDVWKQLDKLNFAAKSYKKKLELELKNL